MQIYDRCDITYDDDLFADEDQKWTGGRVIINGRTASLLRPRINNSGSFDQFDRLTQSTVRDTPDGVVITGTSERLVQFLALPAADATVTVKVVSHGGCSTC